MTCRIDHRSPPSMYRILSHSSLPVLEKVPSSNPARTGCATLGTSLNFFQTSFHLLCNEDIGTTSEVSSSYSPYPPPTPKKHIKIKIKYEKLWHHCIHSWSAFKLLFYTEIYIHRVLQRNLQLAPSKVNSIFIIASRLPITMEHLGKDSAESVTGTPTESAISHALIDLHLCLPGGQLNLLGFVPASWPRRDSVRQRGRWPKSLSLTRPSAVTV